MTEPAAQTADSTRSPSRDVRATPQPLKREGMAMTIVDSSRPITGGVDTHLDNHVAAALDANGGVLGVESFPTTTAGFVALHDWLCAFGPIGTGRCRGHRRVWRGPVALSPVVWAGRDRGRSHQPSGPSHAGQVRSGRRDRSGPRRVVGPGVGDRENRGRERRSDPGVAGRATFRPPSPRPVLEPDPSPRFHQPRCTARTVP